MDSLSFVMILLHLAFEKNLKVDFLLFRVVEIIWEWYFILHLRRLIRVCDHWVLLLNWLKILCINWVLLLNWLLILCIYRLWGKNSMICMWFLYSLSTIFLIIWCKYIWL